MPYKYSAELKESIVKKMIPPNPISVSQLVKETGISDVTLYKWRKGYRNQGIAVPANKNNSDRWIAEDKLAVVIETASFNDAQLSEYCRSKSLLPTTDSERKTA
ncbi:MAG: transposase [Gammaproteobacteria bacterium]|nr:transposase [Gammaproteobacteria bacterium]